MNTARPGDGQVHGAQAGGEWDGQTSKEPLDELRRRLANALAHSALTGKKHLADLAGLSRGTVQAVFGEDGPVPTEHTVTALARTLKLPADELLALRRAAIKPRRRGGGSAPGKPIHQWEPHDLEVHPASPASVHHAVSPGRRALPGYVRRHHDHVLAKAVSDACDGHSRIVVLVGGSSTGKTRACWEAVQPLADKRWWLWHPFDPTRAEAALEDLHRVQPHTVVWLNESQHYLGGRAAGERIAAAVHSLLTDRERGPVLVLGTLWPEYASQYAALPSAGEEDRHSRVRELLSGHTLTVPDAFDAEALATATTLAQAGEALLADALTRAASDGRVTQDLAGAPELIKRYEHATPAARAVLEAAMDARRLGVGLRISQAFLVDAATDYLNENDYGQLAENWSEQAFAELAEPVHGKQAPLRRITPRPERRPSTPSSPDDALRQQPAGAVFRLADYLEQHGRTTRRRLCPHASFWHAAHTHISHPDDLNNLAHAAKVRHRLEWAYHLYHRAAIHGSTDALYWVVEMLDATGDRAGAETMARHAADHGATGVLHRLAQLRLMAGDRDSAERFYQQAADQGDTSAMFDLVIRQESAENRAGAETIARQAADHGDTRGLKQLADMRSLVGDRDSAERLYRQAADYGNTDALRSLIWSRKEAGDWAGAEAIARQAAAHGNTSALCDLAWAHVAAGDRDSADGLYRQAAAHGSTDALYRLVEMLEATEDRSGAEAIARQAADQGDTSVLKHLAEMRDEARDWDSADGLYRQAADHGDTDSLRSLILLRERKVGDRAGAEAVARQAAEHGDTLALGRLALWREEAGDRTGAETMARQAADHGDTLALRHLAWRRELAGDWAGAETMARQAADHGDTKGLCSLAWRREEAGDPAGAEAIARQAAEHGDTFAASHLVKMRKEAGDWSGAEAIARQAADYGDADAASYLAEVWEDAGDRAGAETMARQAADHGDTLALRHLAWRREEAGDPAGAEAIARQAADHGDPYALSGLAALRAKTGARDSVERLCRLIADQGIDDVPHAHGALIVKQLAALWPNGLDPNGAPTLAWPCPVFWP
ncbi:hypothetical protein ABZT03_37520 [Streptomyces sp. NPDC005574]|uniref:tetratricopeptide repeat protein n=1 Tax=Streptomyces sp. NPDC005574 TaxID=3156891 RepID=UPI0033BECBA6